MHVFGTVCNSQISQSIGYGITRVFVCVIVCGLSVCLCEHVSVCKSTCLCESMIFHVITNMPFIAPYLHAMLNHCEARTY